MPIINKLSLKTEHLLIFSFQTQIILSPLRHTLKQALNQIDCKIVAAIGIRFIAFLVIVSLKKIGI